MHVKTNNIAICSDVRISKIVYALPGRLAVEVLTITGVFRSACQPDSQVPACSHARTVAFQRVHPMGLFDKLKAKKAGLGGYTRPQMPLPAQSSSALPDLPIPFPSSDHPQPPVGCNSQDPVHTNNFYNNLALQDQSFPVWTLPYSLWLAREPDQDGGLAFNHTEAAQQVFGPDPGADPAQFYFNPPRIKSFVFSARAMNPQSANIELEDHKKMSVTAKVVGGGGAIVVPLVQGMGFVTGIYQNLVPLLASQVGFQAFKRVGSVSLGTTKYKALLFNQVVWLVYSDDPDLTLTDPNHVSGRKNGAFVQVCRGESKFYDESAGIWPVSCDFETHGNQYRFNYNMSRLGTGLVWCLPHHQEVLSRDTENLYTKMKLDSPTKGVMKAYATNQLVMEERDLPKNIVWEIPGANYSHNQLSAIKSAATQECKDDVVGMANIDSMYTSGKILDKYAYIAYVCHFVLKDEALTGEVLPKVKQAIEIFASNRQTNPLTYDKSWKGVRSTADPAADFGNSNYNDHHFHYGYHVHAIALVAKIDPGFLSKNNNQVLNYVTALVRDFANPVADGKFPQFRSFDWFHGHSFAHGIFASGDGKDEESSSEDYHSVYGLKLYASVTGNQEYEQLADLMLAVMRRAINMYMLYSDDNRIQPKRIIKNKVSGILFENKIDYSTYFGRGSVGDEWIHGIHMIPLTPMSPYMRSKTFVQEEWDQKLAPLIDRIPDGWKGLLMLNYAIVDPKRAWAWFSGDECRLELMDNGMSRTWSLAYIAGLGGC